MNPESEHIEELIGKFLFGEASEPEAKELKEWCAISPENQKYLDDAQWIVEKSQLSGQKEFDSEIAWAKVGSKINPEKVKRSSIFTVWKIAASLVLLIGLSYLFYIWMTPKQEFQYLSKNRVETYMMPDLTEITLNQQSEILVEYSHRKNKGTIQLTGEALISIPEGKKVNWIVKTGDLLIEDIGTIFQVNAHPDNPIVEVTVQEGIVRFYSKNQEGITLQAGEKGTYDRYSELFSKSIAGPNVAAFKTRMLTFQEEELGLVIATLESVYGKKIILAGNISTCKLTVVFENEDLETVLSVISETLGLEVIDEENLIRISGDGCF
ncbi:FecR family protein [Shivajiella indica]|uniref:FecR family protein n=1 Tax=Shivajiella indica TaxID=872115 RepID=A0ABW5BC91_9BACT